MNQSDAIKRATEFIFRTRGVSPQPESTTIVARPDGRRYWSVVYRQESFFPEKAAAGVVMDGPYVLHVDESTGEVSVLG